jgi:uncharacterized protein
MTQERIEAVDVLRGVAILGILLLNVLGWGLPWTAVSNPSAWGGSTGIDLAYWYAEVILFDGKFRGLFSMLFGASALLLIRRRAGVEVADIYYRRTLWLIAIGLCHAYLLTVNDILFLYGLCGLVLFPLRKARPRALIAAGLGIMLLMSLIDFRSARWDVMTRRRALAIDSVEAHGGSLTALQVEQRQMWVDLQQKLQPDTARIRRNIEVQRSGYRSLLDWRISFMPELARNFYVTDVWDALSMMLIGMGLAMLGVITGERSAGFYLRLALVSYGIGIPIKAMVAWMLQRSQWVGLDAALVNSMTQEPARLAVTLGHMSLVLLVVKRGWFAALTARLAAAGRMALSNYLLTSLLVVPFFAGYGLGMFGRLQRHQLLYVVFAVWAIMLAWSLPWLRSFRYGPVEWVWRSLTMWAPQPMRLSPGERPGAPLPTR